MCACRTAIFFFSTGLSGSHDCLSVFMLVYRHACLPLSLSIRLRVFLHVSLPVISLYMLGCLSICLSVFLSTSTSLCINLSTGHCSPCVCLSVCFPVCLVFASSTVVICLVCLSCPFLFSNKAFFSCLPHWSYINTLQLQRSLVRKIQYIKKPEST